MCAYDFDFAMLICVLNVLNVAYQMRLWIRRYEKVENVITFSLTFVSKGCWHLKFRGNQFPRVRAVVQMADRAQATCATLIYGPIFCWLTRSIFRPKIPFITSLNIPLKNELTPFNLDWDEENFTPVGIGLYLNSVWTGPKKTFKTYCWKLYNPTACSWRLGGDSKWPIRKSDMQRRYHWLGG